MGKPIENYTLVCGTSFIQRLWYLYHRLGIWSNVIVSAQYVNLRGNELTRPLIIAALRAVVEAHPALWHVFVQRASSRKGCHGLHTAALRVIDLDECIEILEDPDDSGVTSEILERLHNEWSWTTDEPERPWWKVLVKGRNITFVYHHSVCDGMSGVVFHREFLSALDSIPAEKLERPQKTILYHNDTIQGPLEPTEIVSIKPRIIELLWAHLVCWFFKLFYRNSRIYGNLPPSKPHLEAVTVVADSAQRTVTRISSYRIPAAKMSQIIAACRANQTTFTPLLITMLTVVLSTEYYPDALVGCSRYNFDLRPYLPMALIGGGTNNGTIFNGTASGEQWHKLAPFRRVVAKGSNKVDPRAVWDLVREYKEGMTRSISGKGLRSWMGLKLMGPDLEDTVKAFSSISLMLKPTYGVSNVGAFSRNVAGIESENPSSWYIDDMQLSAAAVNGRQGSHGAIFHVAGVKEGDTVINATYEDGVMSRDMVEGILHRAITRIYEMI